MIKPAETTINNQVIKPATITLDPNKNGFTNVFSNLDPKTNGLKIALNNLETQLQKIDPNKNAVSKSITNGFVSVLDPKKS